MMKLYYEDSAVKMTDEEWRRVPPHIRSRLRKKGFDVPIFSSGVKPGYKQSVDHISKRKKFGQDHHAWKGDNANVRTGRTRAERIYKATKCQVCGKTNTRIDRHHKDGNTLNNNNDNIMFLCRKCHMAEDGRLVNFIKLAKENQPNAVASRWN